VRWLTISLFSAILFASVGLGWLFDTIYLQYVDKDQNKPKDAITVMEQMGKHISLLVDASVTPEQVVNDWPSDGQYQLLLESLENMPFPAPLLDQFYQSQPLTLETKEHIEIHFYLPNHQRRLKIVAPVFAEQHASGITAYVFTGLFYTLLLLLMAVWLTPLLKRLMLLRKTATKFGEGELSQRIDVGSVSYIRDLEFEFNRMAQRIEDLVTDVKLLSSAVSHDLRTPLSSIRFGIDTLQEEDDPKLRRKFEDKISRDVDEMITLVETLLNYARLDQAMLKLDKTEVDLVALLQQITTHKSSDSLPVLFEIEDNTKLKFNVYGDRNYLSMLFNNLIENARQHAKSQVHVRIGHDANNIKVIVADDGKGIAESERDNIIKPFVRGDKTRSGSKGFGIGLAIVSRVLHWHQGELRIERDEELQGAQFIVVLPK